MVAFSPLFLLSLWGMPVNLPEDPGSKVALTVGFGLFCMVLMGVALLFIKTLRDVLNGIQEENQEISPEMVWLLFFPLFNLIWIFPVVLRMSRSLQAEYESRGWSIPHQPLLKLGVAMGVLILAVVVPKVGWLLAIAGIICGLIYWRKMIGYKNELKVGSEAKGKKS